MSALLALNDSDLVMTQKYAQFVMVLLMQMFMFCWMGQRVKDSWSDMTKGMYCGTWYSLQRQNMKLMNYVMMGVSQSVLMKVGKVAPLDLETFTSTLKRLVSLFSVFRASLL